MADSTARAFDALNQELERENMLLNAAEMHGMVSGLVASAAPLEAQQWLGLLADLANEGQAFSPTMRSLLQDLNSMIASDLADPELSFQLLLPGDEEPLGERLKALTAWVQSFLVGFGVNQQNLAQASEDLREAIQDMAEIARLSDDVDSDEEGERAYYEVTEYVRITAIMCFNELAKVAVPHTAAPTTLH
ncbi:UPF0149 family protein [Aliidiomarina maris]|uniref:YecA family protein n=1 Tax=Aliidiomarina maris TaxID=531312 RepID=A0A327WRM3_9GAMM|nr:UPF0149 family protein [Aliidiomarina maris]RAJ95402.1 hypothetical protein B0I24_11086 [Aliidiomarina maris]RUO22790.1 YecA family protein [Aliidiomarina maris]